MEIACFSNQQYSKKSPSSLPKNITNFIPKSSPKPCPNSTLKSECSVKSISVSLPRKNSLDCTCEKGLTNLKKDKCYSQCDICSEQNFLKKSFSNSQSTSDSTTSYDSPINKTIFEIYEKSSSDSCDL